MTILNDDLSHLFGIDIIFVQVIYVFRVHDYSQRLYIANRFFYRCNFDNGTAPPTPPHSPL